MQLQAPVSLQSADHPDLFLTLALRCPLCLLHRLKLQENRDKYRWKSMCAPSDFPGWG